MIDNEDDKEEFNHMIDAFIDAGTKKAFVDGIMGKFEFVGESPVALRTEFK